MKPETCFPECWRLGYPIISHLFLVGVKSGLTEGKTCERLIQAVEKKTPKSMYEVSNLGYNLT